MRRAILIPLLVIVIFFAIAGGIGYYFYNSYMYYQTDDAQVTGQIVSINSPATGQLTTLSVKQGDRVTAGQTIGSVTPVAVGNAAPAPVNLVSPIAGTIVQASAVEKQTVATGLTVAQVTDLNSLNVVAYIDEGAINNISTGQQVDIHIDAYKSNSYSGHVQQIVQASAASFSLLPTQDNASGNFTKVSQRIPVIITLNSHGGTDLVPGLSAEVTVHLH